MSFQKSSHQIRQKRDYFMKWSGFWGIIGIVFLLLFMFSGSPERPFIREIVVVCGIGAIAWFVAMLVFLIWHLIDSHARHSTPRPVFPVPDRYRSA
ncbi:hypothetical protein A2419_02460 [Candidatus Adlerbacteria bacterium RIFOXYC1_FULL_48_26]|uniref:Uncharacterized protein n=1 Tax=Candidatus Adlerbacteria bacterium RIFOXYC1_FULL_48_26 TaxID=1797247 RepID=A0A1F4Y4F5_9BACT|nr:MAG: hypothetical protein A2419_02460 [Candidatus Adlerbacteria bacterium RIFOXYC1_FULL_48_26]